MNVKKYFIEKYINKFNESDYIGVEIEMAIIATKPPYTIDYIIINNLFATLLKQDFSVETYDNDGNIISIKNNKTNDTISLEYSFNTIELSLNKELTINKLHKKFKQYYDIIIKVLKKYDYDIYFGGINPNYKRINKRCINQDRYNVIEKLLSNSNNNELYNQFCAYCCSIQTHINTSKNNIVELFNMLTMIENNKSKLFANSYMRETNKKNSRRYLWKNSNFAPLNVGTNCMYRNLDHLINNYVKRYLFFVERNGEYLLFDKKQPVNKYFDKKKIKALDYHGRIHYIIPSYYDLDNFRSYKSVEITRYGTLEIRSDCTQKKEDIFKVVAFNVGICKNYKKVLKYLKKYKKIDNKKLIELCVEGLKMRNQGEEKYMEGKNE